MMQNKGAVEMDPVVMSSLDKAQLRELIQRRLSYRRQFWALLAKTAIAQRRDSATNACQVLTPIILMVIFFILRLWVASLVNIQYEDQLNFTPEAPFFMMSLPHKGVYLPQQAQILYGDAGLVGDLPLGTFNPVNSSGYGLLGGLKNATINMKIAKYVNQQLYIADTSRFKTVSYPYTIINRTKQEAVDRTFYASYGQPALYTSAVEFKELSVGGGALRFDVHYNETLTRGRDIVGAISFFTQAFAKHLPASSRKAVFNFLGVKQMPRKGQDEPFDISGLVGALFYVFMLHMLLPVFTSTIVFEKEKRIREMMKMSGLRMPIYWLVNYIWCYFLYIISVLFLIISGVVLEFRFFTVNSFWTYFFLFAIWGHVMVAMAFLLSVLFQRERSAAAFGYFVILAVTFVVAYTMRTFVETASEAMCILLSEVSFSSPGIQFDNINEDPSWLSYIYAFLLVEWVVILVAALYLDQVFPGEFGLPKHPLFFLKPLALLPFVRSCLSVKRREWAWHDLEAEADGTEMTDIETERSRAHSGLVMPLKVQDLSKVYDVPFWEHAPLSWRRYVPRLWGGPVSLRKAERALQGSSFCVGPNECLGFLGPNGAGKTTSMSIICGLIQPSGGAVQVFQFGLPQDIAYVHLLTGVCPQHDVIWGGLTAKEHLEFYGRVKGMPSSELDVEVEQVLKSLGLFKVRDRQAGTFSGGMRRRLSVGMSLMGDPKLILLDEPSTGLDPKSKRALWAAISEKKKTASLILTTHSMEEAEALCTRMVIMNKGGIRAIGTAAELKSRFGNGFKLTLTCPDPANTQPAIEFIKELVPGASVVNNICGTVYFYLPKKSMSLGDLFQTIEDQKDSYGISNWGITNATLEEVFHTVVSGLATGRSSSVDADDIQPPSDDRLEISYSSTSE